MNEILSWTLSLGAGVLLGGIFFGGLWWTVKKVLSSQRPGLWLSGSLLLRTAITLTGFYLIGNGHWERLLVCLIGFVLARTVIQWLTRPSIEKQAELVEEAHHAS